MDDATIHQAHAAGWSPSLGDRTSAEEPHRSMRAAWRILTRQGRRALAVERHGPRAVVHLVARPEVREDDTDRGADCREQVALVAWVADPPLALVLRNRLRAIAWWLVFFAPRFLRLRFSGQTFAHPTIGRRGPWSAPVPMAFRGVPHAKMSCAGLRPLARVHEDTTPQVDGCTRIKVSRRGWRALPRHEPELYGPQVEGWRA